MRVLSTLVCLILIPGALHAQQPAPLGTAAGLGLGAMTEARFGEAALWNPALGGIFDGPMTSLSLFGVYTEPGPVRTFWDLGTFANDAMDQNVLPVESSFVELLDQWRQGSEVPRLQAQGTIQWLSIHSQDLLVSLTSHAYVDYQAPDRILAIMSGDRDAAMEPLTTEDVTSAYDLFSRRAVSTVLSMAKAHDLGTLPVLGRTWVGAGAKATLVHEHAIGRFIYEDPALISVDGNGLPLDSDVTFADGELAGVYSEISAREARVYGMDVGVVFNPSPPILVSVSATNLFQKSQLSVDPADLEGRWFAVAGADSLGQGRVFANAEPLDLYAEERPWWTDGEYLAEGTHFTPILRVGLSIDTKSGRFLGGIAVPLEDQYAIDRNALDQYSFGWQSLTSPSRPRITYTRRLDGTSGIMAGFQRGFCSDRFAFSGGYLKRPSQGRAFAVSVAWSRGSGPCGRFR